MIIIRYIFIYKLRFKVETSNVLFHNCSQSKEQILNIFYHYYFRHSWFVAHFIIYIPLSATCNYLALHRNGHSIAVANSNGRVEIFDTRSKKRIQRYFLHDNATCVCWHPKASYLLSCGKDKTLCITDALEGKPLYTLSGHTGEVLCVTFSKDGEHFASGGSDKLVMVSEQFAKYLG